MKKIILAALTLVLAMGANASSFDLKDLLGGSNSSEESSQSSGSGILDAISGIATNLTSTSNFSVDDIIGTWNYSAPAVSFKSDDALKKIGGAGASAAVEAKLKPYYSKAGLEALVLTVEEDHSFTMKMKFGTLKGTIEKDEDNNLVFSFSAFGKVSLGKVNAQAVKSGSTLTLTFDASKLIAILEKVSSVVKINSLSTISSLLSSYDGIYMGFKLKKQ